MKVLISQINPIVGDLEYNSRKIISCIEKAKKEQLDLVVFPEMALCGYPPEDLLLLPKFIEKLDEKLEEILNHCDNINVILGTTRKNPSKNGKELFNSAAVIFDKKIIGYQDKSLLPTYDVFDEHRYFEHNMNFKTWNIAGKTVAITICEDIWQDQTHYQLKPLAKIKALTPELVLNIAASPFNIDKPSLRHNMCSEAARYLETDLIICNQVGANDSLIFDGHSQYINNNGQLLLSCKGFQEELLVVDTEIKHAPMVKENNNMKQLYSALVLGVRDYFNKLGFKKACLGLSGGIDSALVACIAVEALGSENVFAINMPSRYSSEGSIKDSQKIAENLSMKLTEIPIESPFESFLNLLGPHFEEKEFDATEENLQARIRGMILMALSNKHGYIILSTGNKSEMAMGYSTLYGDMCGGLSVISDLLKTEVYQLADYINREKEIIPRETIEKAPSAELRPNQKDSDSLPDYEIVDTILREYIEKHRSAELIASENNIKLKLVQDLIQKIHLNEYKRRQAPPGLRISSKAFSKGRIFPIVQKWI